MAAQFFRFFISNFASVPNFEIANTSSDTWSKKNKKILKQEWLLVFWNKIPSHERFNLLGELEHRLQIFGVLS